MQRNNRGKKNNKLAHYIWSGGIQVHGSPEILRKRNFLHSRRTVELVQPRDRVLLCGWTVPLKLTLADDGTLSGRVFYFFILYNRFKTASSILLNKETKNTASSFFFQRKPSRVSLRRIYFNLLFFFSSSRKITFNSFAVRHASLSSHLSALLCDGAWVLCNQLVSVHSSGPKKNINQFIKKKKKENIHQTPQKSNINMKWDNSVLPWLIIWKRAALNPPEK